MPEEYENSSINEETESVQKETSGNYAFDNTDMLRRNSERKKGHPWLIWTLITLLLCVASSYTTAMLVSNSLMNKANEDQVVIFENTGTDKTTVNVSTTDLSSVVAEIEDTVVEVYTESVQYNSFYGEYVTSGAGSGVIISENGYIVTNNHVIENARSIRVALHNGSDYPAVLVGKDSQLDIAILKIDETGLPVATLGDSDTLKVGESCIAIGNPLGTLGGTVTTGVISALSRSITIDGHQMKLLQTDTTINPGNSGGGLFDIAGNLVGITNAKYSSEKVEGIGFAIPINAVKEIINDLIVNGRVTGRPVIGINCISIENERYMSYYEVDRKGVYVKEVTIDAAYQAGLRAKDLIIGLDEYQIEGFDDLQEALSKYKAGDSVMIKVVRDGKEMQFKVLLSERTE